MSAVTIASAPEDAAALEAAEAHHVDLAGELAGRVALLLTAAEREPGAAERIRAGLVSFCERELLPHAAAEEAVLYPAARRLPDSRLLIESLIAEHSCLAALVGSLRAAPTALGAAADARALQVLFEEHVAKENGLVLPLLAVAPGVRLAALLADLRDMLARQKSATDGTAGAQAAGTAKDATGDATEESGGCGGGCGCGGEEEAEVPELDVRDVPHALRHATVFGALDAVPAGNAMVLVAPHDPLPLLAQIEQREPGRFGVEYLQRGPDAWRLRLSHR
ncbi:DUF2249 domain-containing protein [Streptomyces ferrugineus]|uniref:DUF2249 domain-containing protein n=1 Tax=Streptomyces ferrugineus TaxID=1413221 RepID=A0A7M2SAZ3_9ACTN|nr:DUF2249 domain-containing protein [Streptomyces ferrugineus]QOV33486.1 DUF2249 domain-containing protein [Streptomyces ferrugineus]